MKLGRFDITTWRHDNFRLDGGAMFGAVPKNLWSKKIPGDEENCIPLTSRSLVVRADERVFLVDVGCGDKWTEKLRAIFDIQPLPTDGRPYEPEEVTDIILTHLHFDHAGGLTTLNDGKIEACFPKAKIHLQQSNFENGKNPNLREKASYLQDHVCILDESDLNLIDGEGEIIPGLSVHQLNGHTRGLQWVKIEAEGQVIAFPSDLIPTAHHIPLPYVMGYDICTETTLNEKANFLEQAVEEEWLVVFEHDRDTVACKVKVDERGQYCAYQLDHLI